MTKLLTSKEVEAQYGLSAKTLKHWRHIGVGPRFHQFGRKIQYDAGVIESYIAQHRVTPFALAAVEDNKHGSV
jgi:hypothetical protein